MTPENLLRGDPGPKANPDLSHLLRLLEMQVDEYINNSGYAPSTAINVIDMQRADTDKLEPADTTA